MCHCTFNPNEPASVVIPVLHLIFFKETLLSTIYRLLRDIRIVKSRVISKSILIAVLYNEIELYLLLFRPLSYLGSAQRVFIPNVPPSCYFSLRTPFFYVMYFLITKLDLHLSVLFTSFIHRLIPTTLLCPNHPVSLI